MYVLVDNNHSVVEYPYSIEKMKKDNSTVSFPKHLSEEVLNSFNVYSVVVKESPSFDPVTHEATLSDSIYLEEEVWYLDFIVREKTEDEKQLYAASLAYYIREKRDSLLKDSDWTHVTDSALPESQKLLWSSYRTALRDVTDQENFPYSVEWPSFDN